MGLNAALPVLVATLLAVATLSAAGGGKQPLKVGYYNGKHGGVEPIVRDEVYKTLNVDRSKGAASSASSSTTAGSRVVMHPCSWNPSSKNPYPEKVAGSNIGLRAFDVIDKIKARLEAVYPGVVSCADILAFAARDATRYLSDGHIDYAVPSGRLDSVVSRAKDADDTLPSSTGSFPDLKKNFGNKGFDVEELVVLSGAHSIGVAHYPSFKDRLAAPQSEIDAKYQTALRNAAKNKSRTGALQVRRVLRTDAFALSKLKEYRDKPKEWDSDFADAMVKLGKLLPAEGEGLLEIRKKCSAVNTY
ncbi:hypothetical protein HU200_043584 [Digitaria exilis]|uniref:Peroxidase n=1 Tax=Digitaria exilis TaxID=1010633 RepID=A0A835B332_9POAL|nr:hypothetical protein HU200_043584 [Digitaria exilis]